MPKFSRQSPMALGACIWAACFALVASAGCGERLRNFVPEPDVAESALVRGLDLWREQGIAGEVPGTSPKVFVTDEGRVPSQKLIAYRILGETPGKSGRTYIVELELDEPSERLKTEYIIVGIDPIWVFRRDDYELFMHWDHHMPELPSQLNQNE